MIITQHNIQCIWNGTLAGILLRDDSAATEGLNQTTIKIIGIHGWLDNLNSLLPLAKQLIQRHPNYEIFLYDRAGHGFSSHLPKGFDYSAAHNTQDLRTIIQTLGWNKEKFSIIGHSYGAILGMMYAACYRNEVSCLVTIDALPRAETSSTGFFQTQGSRIDASLQFHKKPSRAFDLDLTFEKVFELTKATRPGITDEATRLLAERSARRDTNNKLHFTRDESLKILSLIPATEDMARDAFETVQASILFIGASKPQWPRSQKSIDLLEEYSAHFEMTLIDGPHHLHMTHVDQVADRIDQYFDKYLPISTIENSKV